MLAQRQKKNERSIVTVPHGRVMVSYLVQRTKNVLLSDTMQNIIEKLKNRC